MELLYNNDAYIREFFADVVAVSPATYKNMEVWDVVLDRSCFFPEQGGQDSDPGELFDIDSDSVYKVVHVDIKDDILHHLVVKSQAVQMEPADADTVSDRAAGVSEDIMGMKRVHGMIDWDQRFDKMQQHSAEHLVSGTVNRFFGFDNVGFHLSSDEVILDFNGKFTAEELLFIEKTVNRAVFENFESHCYFPSAKELEKLSYRSKKVIEGAVRIVEYPGYDICACCAPHVKRTGEIGIVKIVSSESWKGGTRLMIKCGLRAFYDYSEKFEACREISQLLSSKQNEVAPAVNKLMSDYRRLKYSFGELQGDYLDCLVKNSVSQENPSIFVEEADVNVVREAVKDMMELNDSYCCCFTGSEQTGYSYIIGSSNRNCSELLQKMQSELNAKGGGKSGMIQGRIMESRETIKAFLAKA